MFLLLVDIMELCTIFFFFFYLQSELTLLYCFPVKVGNLADFAQINRDNLSWEKKFCFTSRVKWLCYDFYTVQMLFLQ